MAQEKTITQKAVEKISLAMKKAGEKHPLAPLGAYLIKRCTEDQAMAEDVMQQGKTWEGLTAYIMKKARKSTTNSKFAMVEDKVVYEWAEDYFHAAETSPQATGEAKKEETVKPSTTDEKPKEEPTEVAPEAPKAKPVQEEKPKKEHKARRKKGEMEGQMSLFDMMS